LCLSKAHIIRRVGGCHGSQNKALRARLSVDLDQRGAVKEADYNRKGEADHMDWGNASNRRAFIVSILGVGSFIATATLLPQSASAQTDKVQTSMAALKAKTGSLGPLGSKGLRPSAARKFLPCILGQPK
jgi:hypothetical protein